MTELTIDNETFTLCDSWDELTFGQSSDIQNIRRANDISDNQANIPTDVRILLYGAISDKPELLQTKLKDMKYVQFKELETVFDFKPPSQEDLIAESEFIQVEDKRFKMEKDFSELNAGEMVSFELMLQNNKDISANELAFGILLREVNEDGTLKSFSEKDFTFNLEVLRNKVKMTDVQKHINFFLNGEKTSTTKPLAAFSLRKIPKQ